MARAKLNQLGVFMSRSICSGLVLSVMVALFIASDAGAGAPIPGLYTAFGSNSESTLARIDPETGWVTEIGPISGDVGKVGGLAYDSRHDVLYATAWSSNYLGGNYWGSLFRIDPTTGSSELVGATGHLAVGGLGYDSRNDVLYGGAGTYPNNYYLIRIDRTTGRGDRVGNHVAQIVALEYLPMSDQLVYIDVNFVVSFPSDPPRSELREVNRTTGAGTLIGPTGSGGIYGMAYDPTTDRLYALPGSDAGALPGGYLLTIDPATGAASRHRFLSRTALYGSMAYVPEPAAGAAALIVAAALVVWRRRPPR
jgi:hypothetical protein